MTVSGTDHGDERQRTLAEVSQAEGRRPNWGQSLLQEAPSGNLLTGWVASGIKRA